MKKEYKILVAFFSLVFILILAACTQSSTPAPLAPQYYSPLKNADYVSTGATIILRYGPTLSDQNLADIKFSVQGSKSGSHSGKTILADDHKTVIFKPDQTFNAGEQVTVEVNSLQLDPQTTYAPLSYSFSIATNQQPGHVGGTEPATTPPKPAFPNFLTLPQDIPHYTVSKTSPDNGEGFIFVAPFYWTKSTLGSYLLILNGQGQIVYYQSVADALNAFDFKVQPNGMLSYFDQKNSTFYVMDSHYKVVNTYQAGNGYVADLHDLQILPNGNALLMAYDDETVDMSTVVQGGKKDATVTGLIIQELDPSKNVIFEWRSWDHIAYSESTVNLTEQEIDLVHGNALELANDGNLLLSSRNLSEITKINLQTGDVMWRFGGKANMFEIINGQPFAYQHDVRQLPNGDITIFDNQGTEQNPAPSHAIEYKLDVARKTATKVWEYTHKPPVFATFMGNTQRLADGNTFLDWGAPSTDEGYVYVNMTEVTPDNQTVFELAFDQPYVSYRAFRFPWQGFPDTLPALASKVDNSGVTLGYSWNGATEVASYNVLGGNSAQSLSLIEEKAKTDFETQSHLTNLPQGECYFQVAAMDKRGNEMARSKIISTDPVKCPLTP
jgi:outer membrane lipoprotein-sorting protein